MGNCAKRYTNFDSLGHKRKEEKKKTRKDGSCDALQLEPPDISSGVLRFNNKVHAKFEVDWPIRFRLIKFLLLIPYVMLWPWPLTLWLSTFVMYRLWHGQTLYQTSSKLSNSRRSYCDFWMLNLSRSPSWIWPEMDFHGLWCP